MALNSPYKRTVRPFLNGKYNLGRIESYMHHPSYAVSPKEYIRSYVFLQNDLKTLFEYIEPTDQNEDSYGFRILSLFIRVCIEVEANCKAILIENGYSKKGNLTMDDYKKIEESHKLSKYTTKLLTWNGDKAIRKPFLPRDNGGSLQWYKTYNNCKHDRQNNFQLGSLGYLIDAMSGLAVLIGAQFYTEDFTPGESSLVWSDGNDGMVTSPGNLFRVQFPDPEVWDKAERYGFGVSDTSKTSFSSQDFTFSRD